MTGWLHSGHDIQLLKGGAEFFPALECAIRESVSEVRLETYIFQFDASGERVADALASAAQRGVAVFLVMDGIGTPPVPTEWVRQFTAAGVRWCRFSPLGRLGLLVPGRWRRLHRKLCVVDGRVAFCGGINVMDDLRDQGDVVLESPRFDFAVRVQGPLVEEVHTAMAQFWARLESTHKLQRLQMSGLREGLGTLRWYEKSTRVDPLQKSDLSPQGTRAALVLRDNVRHRRRIESTYLKAIAEARTDILIANAYFVPGSRLRRALVYAANRGVRVRLLFQGRYESFMQFHAARPVLGALLAAGVEMYEYRAGFLHAKVAVIDGNWATVGSSNLDPLSLLLAREANVVVDDAAFAATLRTNLESAIALHSTVLPAQGPIQRSWVHRGLDWAAYAAMRSLLWITGRRY
jgi:cardiolipin synthase